MANALVPQGTLNRLRSSVVFPDNASLNVTAPYLGRDSIRLTPEGAITQNLPTLTGTVTSPEPYQLMSVRVNLIKSQALANAFKTAWETNSLVGDCTVRTDAPTLTSWQILNCSITAYEPIDTKGDDPNLMVTIQGYYPLNSSLYGS